MGIEENKRVIETRVKALNARDFDSWEALHTDSAFRTAPELSEPLKGRSAMRQALEASIKALDYRLEIRRVFGEDNWLCVEFTSNGKNIGPICTNCSTIPATNKEYTNISCVVFKFEGGKIAEVHEYYDLHNFLAQIGIS